jgi:hypothetical protein
LWTKVKAIEQLLKAQVNPIGIRGAFFALIFRLLLMLLHVFHDICIQEAERKIEEERIRMENIIKGNPLMQLADKTADFKVKRRYVS